MSIAVDTLSGRPLGAAPLITTWGRRPHQKKNRPRFLVIVPAGEEPANREKLSLWEKRVRMHMTDEGRLYLPVAEREWDVYRSRARWSEPGVIVWPLPREPVPVDPSEHAAIEGRVRAIDDYSPDELVRLDRGDYAIDSWAELAPWQLSSHDAEVAGTAGLTTRELFRGVREEHGRWQAYIGLGSMLSQVGTCDTREEALTLATAHLWRAWITRVEEIREARGGDLKWGCPLPSPLLEDENPQERY